MENRSSNLSNTKGARETNGALKGSKSATEGEANRSVHEELGRHNVPSSSSLNLKKEHHSKSTLLQGQAALQRNATTASTEMPIGAQTEVPAPADVHVKFILSSCPLSSDVFSRFFPISESVLEMKKILQLEHPLKPPMKDQRFIFFGKILDNACTLLDITGQKSQELTIDEPLVIHLVLNGYSMPKSRLAQPQINLQGPLNTSRGVLKETPSKVTNPVATMDNEKLLKVILAELEVRNLTNLSEIEINGMKFNLSSAEDKLILTPIIGAALSYPEPLGEQAVSRAVQARQTFHPEARAQAQNQVVQPQAQRERGAIVVGALPALQRHPDLLSLSIKLCFVICLVSLDGDMCSTLLVILLSLYIFIVQAGILRKVSQLLAAYRKPNARLNEQTAMMSEENQTTLGAETEGADSLSVDTTSENPEGTTTTVMPTYNRYADLIFFVKRILVDTVLPFFVYFVPGTSVSNNL